MAIAVIMGRVAMTGMGKMKWQGAVLVMWMAMSLSGCSAEHPPQALQAQPLTEDKAPEHSPETVADQDGAEPQDRDAKEAAEAAAKRIADMTRSTASLLKSLAKPEEATVSSPDEIVSADGSAGDSETDAASTSVSN